MNPFNCFSLIFFLSCSVGVRLESYAGDLHANPVYPAKVRFVENKNQWPEFIRYEADFNGGKLFLEESQFTYLFYHPDDIQSMHPHEGNQIDKIRLHALKVHPINNQTPVSIVSREPEPYCHNYFTGNDPAHWASNVKLYSSVTYESLYPGVDLTFYSRGMDLKYDVLLKPGSDPSRIGFAYEGADHMTLKDGDLVLQLSVGTVIEQRPYAYQEIDGIKKEVPCRFVLYDHTIRYFFPAGYDITKPLVIDPTLVFSSYTGSSADNWGFTATYDAAGNLYSGGNVNSFGYPITAGAYDVSFNGGGSGGNGWSCDIAIAKFNATGTSMLYATYLGGSDNEQPQSLVVDGNDHLIVFGTSSSFNFPVTAGAYQSILKGMDDIVISKLSSTGNALLASTYVGGSFDDGLNTSPAFTVSGPIKYSYADDARGEIIADAGNDYIVGSCSQSQDFPTTAGTLQPTFGSGNQDGIVFKINSSLSSMIWSTFIGGLNEDAVYDVTIDQSGGLYIAGGTNSSDFPTTIPSLHPSYMGGMADGFLAHITNTASAIYSSTFIGTGSYDQCFFVELDQSGNVYTTGQTEGSYPVTSGVYSNPNSSQFIHKLNASLDTTIYSTVFGNGSSIPNISPTAFLVDTCENVYVAGWGRCLSLGAFTTGTVNGMPVTGDAYQSTTDGCDFYFIVLTRDAQSLLYATYFGGGISQEHVDGGTSRFDKNGVIYEAVCASCGGQQDFPTTPGAFSTNNLSGNCNNGAIKLAFNLTHTVSGITTSPSGGCAPFTLTFINNSINASGYTWDFGDGSPPSILQAPTHTYSNPGIYQVMLVAHNSSSCNQNDTDYATITVTPATLPVASFSVLQNASCDSMSVITQFNGTGGNLYSWDFGDGSSSSSPLVSHAYSQSGTYLITLIATDTVCQMNADTASQTVVFHPPIIAHATISGPQTGCTPLTASFTDLGNGSGTHTWLFMDGSNPDTSQNPNHVFNNPGNYDVMLVVSDTASCNGSDTAHTLITVLPSAAVYASFSSAITPDCHTPFVAVQFNGTGGNVYHWDWGDGTISNGPQSNHTYMDTGIYLVRLTVTDSGLCGMSDTASHTVFLNSVSLVAAAAAGFTEGCSPLQVAFSGSGSAGVWHSWNFMDGTVLDTNVNTIHTFINPGIYHTYYVVADPSSCNGSDTAYVSITVYPSMPVSASFTNIIPVSCDTFYTQVAFNGSGGHVYEWHFGDRTSAFGTAFTHVYQEPGTYPITLIASDTLCHQSDSVTHTVIFRPSVHADISPLNFRFGCTPLEIDFSNLYASVGTYSWDFGDGAHALGNAVHHTYKIPGDYHILLLISDTASCNLTDSSEYQLEVFAKPEARFLLDQHITYFYTDVSFYNQSELADSYRWDFGDGTSSGEWNVQHRFDLGGDYQVCLLVNTNDGCEDTSCAVVHVENVETIYIPCAFTPNKDGRNDVFRVYATGLTEIHVMIFNRWGTMIYEYDTLDGQWDGTSGGQPVQEDVYVYKMKAQGIIHRDIERIGKVTVAH